MSGNQARRGEGKSYKMLQSKQIPGFYNKPIIIILQQQWDCGKAQESC